MGSLSPYGRNATLDAMLGASHSSAWPATVYLAASTTDPTASLTEPSGGAYARKAVPNNATNFAAASSQQKSNLLDLVFATATAGWGTITHVALMDAASGGNMLASDVLGSAQVIVTGDTLTVPAGGLVVSV